MDFGVNTSGLELAKLVSLAQTAEGVGFTTFYPGDHLVLAQTGALTIPTNRFLTR